MRTIRQSGDESELGELDTQTLVNLGCIVSELGALAEAHALLQEALTLNRAAGNTGGGGVALENLGEVCMPRATMRPRGRRRRKGCGRRGPYAIGSARASCWVIGFIATTRSGTWQGRPRGWPRRYGKPSR